MNLAINNNINAARVANSIEGNYSRLSKSTQRLSSGLRINSAADDAAGLAIRELMRSDIAALRQGARNANDAISLLQVADGALAIIDEKLIRMKELAEQAATGTYDSTQRLMIDSEFQAMGSEIDRIARATDFNGIHLLDGSLDGEHDGTGLVSTGKMKIHFGSGNDSAEDYYYVRVGNCATKGLGLHDPIMGVKPAEPITAGAEWLLDDAVIDWDNNKLYVDIGSRTAGPTYNSPQAISGIPGFDSYTLPVGLENIVATSGNPNQKFTHKAHINLFTRDGTQLTGVNPDANWHHSSQKYEPYNGRIWWNMMSGDELVAKLTQAGILDAGATFNGANAISDTGQSISAGGTVIEIVEGMNETAGALEVIRIDKITSDLVFMIGGHDTPEYPNYCNVYSLKIEADITPELRALLLGEEGELPDQTRLLDIKTQENAQKALTRVDEAIVAKDKIRADLGALQNRLENTVTNLTVQWENLGAAESRISDTDVAIEMTNFIRNQILTQSGTAMLVQANSMPQMLMSLLNG